MFINHYSLGIKPHIKRKEGQRKHALLHILFHLIAHLTHRNGSAADGGADDDGETGNGGRGLRPRQAQDGLEEALRGSALGI